MSSKKISFSIPDYIYNHLREFLNSHGFDYISVADMYKACATNRMISKGYLDEFGQPNPLVIPPKLDFSSLNIPKEQFMNKTTDDYSPCDGCEPNNINSCSSCRFASPSINDSLNYSEEG